MSDAHRAAVDAVGLSRSYPGARGREPRLALDRADLRLERGAWGALLGPNGSGKSTLLRILATLDRPDAGRAAVLGHDLPGEARAVRVRLGVVFQQAGLDPLLTVRENLRNQGALFGLRSREAAQRAEDAARDLGVADRLDDRVGTLSGGLARRVDLARALLPGPDLLLLDEPTTGLDPAARAAFLDHLAARRARTGLTILMTTHLLDEADRADAVFLMHRGRVAASGAPTALRSALGEHVVRAAPEHAAELHDAGLTVRTVRGEAVGVGPAPSIERATAVLTRRGASFTFGPPTLADVYAAATGASLAAGEGAAA